MNETLPHNPRNAVTGTVERIPWAGGTAVRKVLCRVSRAGTPTEWRSSEDPTHFNYWHREYDVYTSGLGDSLGVDGVALPELLDVHLGDDDIVLILEDIEGRTGSHLSFDDFGRIAGAWGRSQRTLMEADWRLGSASEGFLKQYAESKPVAYELLSDDEAWRRPLIAENWPPELREGLLELFEHRDRLFDLLAELPRAPCHLDFWPHNAFVGHDGRVKLIDWAFFGDGALGEDVGNFIPDAVFDGFVPSARFTALETTMTQAYLQALPSAVSATDVELAVRASAVKYVWLAPLLLARAGDTTQMGYGDRPIEEAEVHAQYFERGQGLLHLCRWAAVALSWS